MGCKCSKGLSFLVVPLLPAPCFPLSLFPLTPLTGSTLVLGRSYLLIIETLLFAPNFLHAFQTSQLSCQRDFCACTKLLPSLTPVLCVFTTTQDAPSRSHEATPLSEAVLFMASLHPLPHHT